MAHRARRLACALIMAAGSAYGHEMPQADAAFTFHETYVIACDAAMFRKLTEHPYLAGKLWEAYGFAPQYRFERGTGSSGELRIDDPSGARISGIMHPAGPDPFSYTWHGRGTVRFNRNLPVDAVITMEINGADSESMIATVDITLYSGSGLARGVMLLSRPLISHYVNKRCFHHTADIATMLRGIKQDSASALARLSGGAAEEFGEVFAR